jgi:kynurenine formamidase
MTRRYVDLSICIESGVESDPEPFRPKVFYQQHKESVESIASFFPGLKPEHLPDGEGWAAESLQVSTHNGTHMDAPWHFHSTQDAALPGGPRRSMTIDEVPLDWCLRPGVKLDFRSMPDGYVTTAQDIEAELRRIDYELQPFDIVVVNTRAGALYGKPGFMSAGCGMGREATLYLAQRGVKIVGTDAWSWDAPFVHTAKRWAETHDPSIIWEGHKAGREIGYCQMEKLHNLEVLPPHGFDISCFPVKVRAASAGWIRAVAIFNS